MGGGLYAHKLDTNSWIAFNNAQRVQYNYLELLLVCGISYPLYTVIAGIISLLGRTVYTIGYLLHGAAGRGKGATIGRISKILLSVGAIVSAWKISGGLNGLITLMEGKGF